MSCHFIDHMVCVSVWDNNPDNGINLTLMSYYSIWLRLHKIMNVTLILHHAILMKLVYLVADMMLFRQKSLMLVHVLSPRTGSIARHLSMSRFPGSLLRRILVPRCRMTADFSASFHTLRLHPFSPSVCLFFLLFGPDLLMSRLLQFAATRGRPTI